MNEDTNIFLSSNIKFLRNQKGVTLKDLGKAIGKTDSAISYWEQGSREPSAVDIYNLATYFDVNIDDLLTKDLRFDNIKEIGTEITVEEFVKSVNDLIDKAINISDRDKAFMKQSLNYIEKDKDNQ